MGTTTHESDQPALRANSGFDLFNEVLRAAQKVTKAFLEAKSQVEALPLDDEVKKELLGSEAQKAHDLLRTLDTSGLPQKVRREIEARLDTTAPSNRWETHPLEKLDRELRIWLGIGDSQPGLETSSEVLRFHWSRRIFASEAIPYLLIFVVGSGFVVRAIFTLPTSAGQTLTFERLLGIYLLAVVALIVFSDFMDAARRGRASRP